MNRFQARRGLRRHRGIVPRKQQRPQLRDEREVTAEQEAKRLADVRLHRARVDALADEREDLASVGYGRHVRPTSRAC